MFNELVKHGITADAGWQCRICFKDEWVRFRWSLDYNRSRVWKWERKNG